MSTFIFSQWPEFYRIIYNATFYNDTFYFHNVTFHDGSVVTALSLFSQSHAPLPLWRPNHTGQKKKNTLSHLAFVFNVNGYTRHSLLRQMTHNTTHKFPFSDNMICCVFFNSAGEPVHNVEQDQVLFCFFFVFFCCCCLLIKCTYCYTAYVIHPYNLKISSLLTRHLLH